MADLTTLQTRLAALDAMIASGVLRSKHGETELMFRSMDELLRAKALIENDIAAAGGAAKPRLRYAYQSGKGL